MTATTIIDALAMVDWHSVALLLLVWLGVNAPAVVIGWQIGESS